MSNMEAEAYAILKWQKLKDKCEEKILPFGLTVAQIRKLQSRKTCYYTGKAFSDYTSDSIEDRRTLDRIEPHKGYVSGNVVACCQNVNYCKSNLSFEDIESMYLVLKTMELKK